MSGTVIGTIAALTYTDNEAPPVAKVDSAPTSVNEGESIEVKISLSAAFSGAAASSYRTIKFSVNDPDGALSGTLPTNVRFEQNQVLKTVTLTANDNSTMNDGGRDITFTLAVNPDSPYTLGSPSSATVTVLDNDTAPSAPRNLTAEPGDQQVRLVWEAPLHDHGQEISEYEYRQKTTGSFGSWTNIANSDADTTAHTVTGLTNGTSYTFQIRAVSSAGNGANSNEASATAGPAWALTITNASGNAISELTEGGAAGTVTVSITNGVTFSSAVTIALEWGGVGLANSPLSGAGGATSISLAANASSASLQVSVTDDNRFRPTTTERLTGSYSGGSTGGAELTIVDDEAPPVLTISVEPTRLAEGDTGRVSISLSHAYAAFQTLTFGTLEGAAGRLNSDVVNGTQLRLHFVDGQQRNTR